LIRWADVQKMISFVDYRDEIVDNRILKGADVDVFKFVCFYDGQEYYIGFFVFRHLSVVLKRLWWLVPFVFFPGSATVGPKIYHWISTKRKCDGFS